MKPKNLLNYHSNTAPLGEPSQQPKEHPNTPPTGKDHKWRDEQAPGKILKWLDSDSGAAPSDSTSSRCRPLLAVVFCVLRCWQIRIDRFGVLWGPGWARWRWYGAGFRRVGAAVASAHGLALGRGRGCREFGRSGRPGIGVGTEDDAKFGPDEFLEVSCGVAGARLRF